MGVTWPFWLGLSLGLLAAVPVAVWWGRRTEKRLGDLTRRAQTAERLAELGTLTGGLAHEIKNPLSTIGLNIQLLQEDLQQLRSRVAPDSEDAEQLGRLQRRFEALSREAERLRHILEDFLRFAGRLHLDLQPTDLTQLVDELADFFAPQADDAGVRLRVQQPTRPLVVPADESLLKQALLNLLINAVQAMQEARQQDKAHGGANELILRTERRRVLGRPSALVHVTDTGPGVDAELAEKIFTPYFSTKRGGTGLGLPTSKRIIEEHGGQLAVHAEPGRGSDFVITLPLQES